MWQLIIAEFRYLGYVVRHKWFVFRAGLITGAPLWRLLVHDWSKFLPDEWFPYTLNFYVPRRVEMAAPEAEGDVTRAMEARLLEVEQRNRDRFNRAWLKHQHRNAHHWQHWVLQNDDGTVTALAMPYSVIREMVADWAGAGRTIRGRWELLHWYKRTSSRMILHPTTRAIVESLVERTQRHFTQ